MIPRVIHFLREKRRLLPYGIWVPFGLLTAVYTYQILSGGHEFKTSDWLINYTAGPIRRGFIGHLLYWVSGLGLPILWLTYFVQVSCCATLYGLVLKLYGRIQRHGLWLYLLYSPGFLLFSFYQPLGSYRKDILIMALFAFFCYKYATHTLTPLVLGCVALLYAGAGLSHELSALTVPFFIYMMVVGVRHHRIKPKIAVGYSILLIAISGLTLGFGYRFTPPPHATDIVCQSLIERHVDVRANGIRSICGNWVGTGGVMSTADQMAGAIEGIGLLPSAAMGEVAQLYFRSPPYGIGILWCGVYLFLGLLPLRWTNYWQPQRILVSLLGGLMAGPLFVFAIDWGRWVAILIFMLVCIALAEDIQVTRTPPRWLAWLGIIYLTAWSIPLFATGLNGGLMGLGDMYGKRVINGIQRNIRTI